jgi:hypothetical protein
VNGRIIIDTQMFNKFNPQFNISIGDLSESDYILEDIAKQQKIDSTVYETEVGKPKVRLTSEAHLICKTTVPGYSLSLKKWRKSD